MIESQIQTLEQASNEPKNREGFDPTIRGPIATLYLPLEKKVIAHAIQFEKWQKETIDSGKPLNGITRESEVTTQPTRQEEIILFETSESK